MGSGVRHEDYEKIRNGNLSAEGVKEFAANFNVSPDEAIKTYANIKKVAESASFEEFKIYLENGEIPALKLNKTEMENLKGGCFINPPYGCLPILIKLIKLFV